MSESKWKQVGKDKKWKRSEPGSKNCRHFQSYFRHPNGIQIQKTDTPKIKKQAIVGKQPENERKKYSVSTGGKPFRCFVLVLLRTLGTFWQRCKSRQEQLQKPKPGGCSFSFSNSVC